MRAISSANRTLVFGGRDSAHKTTAAPACCSPFLTEELPSVKRVRSGSGRGLSRMLGVRVYFQSKPLHRND
jgi:hypothetical protein